MRALWRETAVAVTSHQWQMAILKKVRVVAASAKPVSNDESMQ